MNKKIKTEAVDHLFEAILTLRTPEEYYIFLRMCARSTSCYPCPSAMR